MREEWEILVRLNEDNILWKANLEKKEDNDNGGNVGNGGKLPFEENLFHFLLSKRTCKHLQRQFVAAEIVKDKENTQPPLFINWRQICVTVCLCVCVYWWVKVCCFVSNFYKGYHQQIDYPETIDPPRLLSVFL